MLRLATKTAFIITLAVPCFSHAARYRIDPQPPTTDPIQLAAEPFSILNNAVRRQVLSLLNFVLDSETEPVEGIDFPKYDRSKQFGSWLNTNSGQNCYNTRAEILIRDSLGPVTFNDRNPCLVKTGVWRDSYTGQELSEAADVQIDHLVPLKNAYVSGAHKWEPRRRCHYGNFLKYKSHLIPVDARANMSKGDRSPADWMPPEPRQACAYLQQWLSVKAVWELTLTEAEARAIHELVQRHQCGEKFQTVTDASFRRQQEASHHVVSACEGAQ